MAATHRIEKDDEDLFRLVPVRPDAVPEEAAILAQAIEAELERFKDRSGTRGLERIAKLRAIAEVGLADESPDLDRAGAELRLGFRYPFVTASGEEDIAVQLPRRATREQIDFIMKLQDADRLVKQLQRERGVPALAVPRWFAGLPARLAARLGGPEVPPAPAPAPPPKDDRKTKQFQTWRGALIAAGRMALPDGGTDRVPEIGLAERHVGAVLKECIGEHGPRVRRESLADLAVAFAMLTLFFGAAMLLVYACWGMLVGATEVAAAHPRWRNFSLLVVAVAFLFLGAWLSAAQRLNSGDAGVLESVFAEPFDSWIRGAILLGVGVIVILLLHKEVLVLTLGDGPNAISTKHILGSVSTAAVCGAFLGLAERVLPGVLSGQANRFIQQFGGQQPAASQASPQAAPNASQQAGRQQATAQQRGAARPDAQRVPAEQAEDSVPGAPAAAKGKEKK